MDHILGTAALTSVYSPVTFEWPLLVTLSTTVGVDIKRLRAECF